MWVGAIKLDKRYPEFSALQHFLYGDPNNTAEDAAPGVSPPNTAMKNGRVTLLSIRSVPKRPGDTASPLPRGF